MKRQEMILNQTILIPLLWPKDKKELLFSDGSIIPEKQREKLNSLLSEGWIVKLANDFQYAGVVFINYVLEKTMPAGGRDNKR